MFHAGTKNCWTLVVDNKSGKSSEGEYAQQETGRRLRD